MEYKNQSIFNCLLGDNPMVCIKEPTERKINKKIKYDYFVLDTDENVIKSFTTVDHVAHYLGYMPYEIRSLISAMGVNEKFLKIHIIANINQKNIPMILIREKRDDV